MEHNQNEQTEEEPPRATGTPQEQEQHQQQEEGMNEVPIITTSARGRLLLFIALGFMLLAGRGVLSYIFEGSRPQQQEQQQGPTAYLLAEDQSTAAFATTDRPGVYTYALGQATRRFTVRCDRFVHNAIELTNTLNHCKSINLVVRFSKKVEHAMVLKINRHSKHAAALSPISSGDSWASATTTGASSPDTTSTRVSLFGASATKRCHDSDDECYSAEHLSYTTTWNFLQASDNGLFFFSSFCKQGCNADGTPAHTSVVLPSSAIAPSNKIPQHANSTSSDLFRPSDYAADYTGRFAGSLFHGDSYKWEIELSDKLSTKEYLKLSPVMVQIELTLTNEDHSTMVVVGLAVTTFIVAALFLALALVRFCTPRRFVRRQDGTLVEVEGPLTDDDDDFIGLGRANQEDQQPELPKVIGKPISPRWIEENERREAAERDGEKKTEDKTTEAQSPSKPQQDQQPPEAMPQNVAEAAATTATPPQLTNDEAAEEENATEEEPPLWRRVLFGSGPSPFQQLAGSETGDDEQNTRTSSTPVTPTHRGEEEAAAQQQRDETVAEPAPAAATTSSSVVVPVADDEDDLPICRICQCTEPIEDLFAPCACKGYSKYVHSECLERWRRTTSNPEHRIKCAECKTDFTVNGGNAEDDKDSNASSPDGDRPPRRASCFASCLKGVATAIFAFFLIAFYILRPFLVLFGVMIGGGYIVKIVNMIVTWDSGIKWVPFTFYHFALGVALLLSIFTSHAHLHFFVSGYPSSFQHKFKIVAGLFGPILLGYVVSFYVWLFNIVIWTPEVWFICGFIVQFIFLVHILPGFIQRLERRQVARRNRDWIEQIRRNREAREAAAAAAGDQALAATAVTINDTAVPPPTTEMDPEGGDTGRRPNAVVRAEMERRQNMRRAIAERIAQLQLARANRRNRRHQALPAGDEDDDEEEIDETNTEEERLEEERLATEGLTLANIPTMEGQEDGTEEEQHQHVEPLERRGGDGEQA